jgi:hypothetical protein
MLRASALSIILAILVGNTLMSAARADHKCDPIGDEGWTTLPTHELLSQNDGTPYREGTSGNWFVDRTTTILPMCNYYNSIGIYSMRSYSLTPKTTVERIGICQGAVAGASAAIAPYAGPCPPL